MTTHRWKYFAAAAALFIIFFTSCPAVSRADVPVELTRVGNPIWSPTDFHLFTAPADTDETFFAVAEMVLGPEGVPTDPPYDNIISDNLASAGFQDATIFLPSDIDGQPSGIYFAYAVVPDPGATGSSPDFASGPIIPNRLYPLTFDHDLLRNGVLVDPAVFDDQIPPLVGVDGDSHELFLLEEDASFFPPGTVLPGNWEYRTVLRDAEGNGWNIVAPFQVVPEPSSLALTLLLAAHIGLFRLRPRIYNAARRYDHAVESIKKITPRRARN
jgi:hypothetical protein